MQHPIVIPDGLSKRELRRARQLKKVLQSYPEFEKWQRSQCCFLNAFEYGVVCLFLVRFDYQEVARIHHISTIRVNTILDQAILKLKFWELHYQRWEAAQNPENKSRFVDPEKRSRFLSLPFCNYELPGHIHFILSYYGYCFCEVLSRCPVSELKQHKGIKAKNWKQIVDLFKENDCEDLLN